MRKRGRPYAPAPRGGRGAATARMHDRGSRLRRRHGRGGVRESYALGRVRGRGASDGPPRGYESARRAASRLS